MIRYFGPMAWIFSAALGSDVPFSLVGHTAVGQGRGHLLTPALSRGEWEALCDGCGRCCVQFGEPASSGSAASNDSAGS